MVPSHFLDLVSYHKTSGNRLTFSFTIFFSPDFTSLITLPEIQESSEPLCGLLVIMIRWGHMQKTQYLATYFYQENFNQLYKKYFKMKLLNPQNRSSLLDYSFFSQPMYLQWHGFSFTNDSQLFIPLFQQIALKCSKCRQKVF